MRTESLRNAAITIITSLTAVCGYGNTSTGNTLTMSDLIEALVIASGYHSDAHFEVLLPSAEDPVTYDIILQSDAAPGDTLCSANYVIRWTTESPGGIVEGFSAYFDGNHYRYRGGNRLQEYHAADNIVPMLPMGAGSADKGVQNTAQFADLLPQLLSRHMVQIATDSCYVYKLHSDTVVAGRKAVVVDGVRRTGGYDAQEFTYVFDRNTLLPVSSEQQSNPGSITEQTITVTYGSGTDTGRVGYSEEALAAQWPDIFERYRESTFRAESLVGRALPTFSCRRLGGDDRFSHTAGEALPQPLLMVFVDPEVSSTKATVDAVREATDMMPVSADVAWVFTGNSAEPITDSIGTPRPGETVLTSAGSLFRNCGIVFTPTILIVDRTGKVADIVQGFNNDLSSIVIQKTMLTN